MGVTQDFHLKDSRSFVVLFRLQATEERYSCNRASKAHATYSPIQLGSSRASGALDVSRTSCMEPFYVCFQLLSTRPRLPQSLKRMLECCFAVKSQIMTEFSFFG